MIFEYKCNHCGIAYVSLVPCEKQCKNCMHFSLSSTPKKESTLPWFGQAKAKRKNEIRDAVDAYWIKQEIEVPSSSMAK